MIDQHGTDLFEKLYCDTIEIFLNLFNQEIMPHHTELFQRFRNLVIDEGRMTSILYKLLKKPFGLNSYDDLIDDFLKTFKIEFELVK